jgi:phage N-6-adenine-methyltransferase
MNDGTNTVRALRTLRNEAGALGEWTPQQTRERGAKIAALKVYAAKVFDWELLSEAVEQEIEDQGNLVSWWEANVQRRGGNRQSINADPGEWFAVEEAEEFCGIPQQKVSRWRAALAGDIEAYRELLRGPSWRKAMGERGSTDQKGASGTGENEWLTPPKYIKLARAVLGTIDLDPATSDEAQRIVNAAQSFTKAHDGLKQEWRGRVWLNPPYAKPLIAKFASKMVAEFRAGRVEAAIMLTHNSSDTRWFYELVGECSAICFTRGRVKFYSGEKVAAPTQGQAFFYFGGEAQIFAETFKAIGRVLPHWRAWD